MAATLGIEIEQRISLYHHRNAGSHFTQGVDALFLLQVFYGVGRIAGKPQLLHFHTQVGFIQPGCFQLLLDCRQ